MEEAPDDIGIHHVEPRTRLDVPAENPHLTTRAQEKMFRLDRGVAQVASHHRHMHGEVLPNLLPVRGKRRPCPYPPGLDHATPILQPRFRPLEGFGYLAVSSSFLLVLV